MIFKLTGSVEHVYDEEMFDKKRGRSKRTILLKQSNSLHPNRIEFIPIDFMDENRTVIKDLFIGTGDLIEVDVELRGRKYTKENEPEKPLCYLNVEGINIKVI